MTLQENLIKLDQMKFLKENWNGYGAHPLDLSFIDRVKDLVRGLNIQPFIAPCPDGSIQIEYEYDKDDINYYLEYELHLDGTMNRFVMPSNLEDGITMNLSLDQINKDIKDFYEGKVQRLSKP